MINYQEKKMDWRCHTPNLIREIGNNNGELSATFRKPLAILSNLLYDVGVEASRINDPKLNALMCRLTIYACADPDSPEYDPELVEFIINLEKED